MQTEFRLNLLQKVLLKKHWRMHLESLVMLVIIIWFDEDTPMKLGPTEPLYNICSISCSLSA